MSNNKLFTRSLPLIAVLIIASYLSVSSIFAQESVGLTIIPPKVELFANPGDTISESIRITNNSNSPQTYNIAVEDFRSTGEEGQVVLEEADLSSYSLRSWIKPSAPAIVAQPGEEVVYPFSIVVPRNAEPGGHYASILFQIGGADNVPGVTSVRSRVGALILLRVSGDVKEEAKIESFDAPKFSQKGPVPFSLRASNNGTTHIRPNGTIIVTNIFGRKVAEVPLSGLNVFPGAIRKMDTMWEKENLFGMYTATLVATYGQQSLPMTAVAKFTVASYFGITMLVLGILALYIFITSLIKGKGRLIRALKMIATGK